MKISFHKLNLPEGKIKFNDPILLDLEKKFQPKKFTPFFAEFINNNFDKSDAITVYKENLLDILIIDIEKLETRAQRTNDQSEKNFINKALNFLEAEKPLCELELTNEEENLAKMLQLFTAKPCYISNEQSPNTDELIKNILNKANLTFFYTAGKQEVRSWLIKKNSDIVTCAGKIHSDLAKGFIKAEIVNYSDFKNVHNMQEARAKGFAKLVDRDYIIQEGDIIEIRFNV